MGTGTVVLVVEDDDDLRHVWHSSSGWQDVATVAEHLYRLRRKLDPTERQRWIHTVRGVGYRFVPDR